MPINAATRDRAATLSRSERTQLQQLEDVLETAKRWQVEEAKALLEIREKRLWRGRYESFEHYGTERWGYERSRLYQLCSWAEVIRNVSTNVDMIPQRESHARPLYGLTPEQQRRAWATACRRLGGRRTAAHVDRVVRDLQERDRPKRRAGASPAVLHGLKPVFETKLGTLYNCDCIALLKRLANESADVFFADPPFNCSKDYGVAIDGKRINDDLPDEEYLGWCQRWLEEAIRVLRPGGALFIYNISRWNMPLGTHLLSKGLDLRHWISVNINGQMPVRGRLMQQGYSLLYFTKGRPKAFNRIWTPMRTCRRCGQYVKDYGGKVQRFEAQPGILLSDVWDDVTAVRHRPFKSEKRPQNQLSTKVVERSINMASRPGDLVVDVFGGSGTTYAVCEVLGRRWIGSEFGTCAAIVERLTTRRVRGHRNDDIVEGQGDYSFRR